MATIVFTEPDGTRRQVTATLGRSIMRNAVGHAIRGILAECNGCASCGTCQAMIAPAWTTLLPVPSENEAAMLRALEGGPGNRLTCQILMAAELDGIQVTLAPG